MTSVAVCVLPVFVLDYGVDEQGLSRTYSGLQAKFWGVGFLSQYQFRQMPNFCIAAPTVALVVWGILSMHRRNQLSWASFKDAAWSPEHIFAAHSVVLTVVVLLFAHVQIIARVLTAASPWLFFVLGRSPGMSGIVDAANRGFMQLCSWLYSNVGLHRPVLLYATVYAVVGTVLHANNFPIT